jgi:hypothetical protein
LGHEPSHRPNKTSYQLDWHHLDNNVDQWGEKIYQADQKDLCKNLNRLIEVNFSRKILTCFSWRDFDWYSTGATRTART